MQIAKKVTANYFLGLDLSVPGKDWLDAISILQRRINERFIEPADKLIELEDHLPASDKKYGFAILALDCLLCETIQSFYDGVTDSSSKSKGLFSKFLMERKSFAPYFSTIFQANDFYYNFRCGIMHQAQTTGNTKVWSVGTLISRHSDKVIVNRIKFHQAIKVKFDFYLAELLAQHDKQLLNNFKKKMTYIAKGK